MSDTLAHDAGQPAGNFDTGRGPESGSDPAPGKTRPAPARGGTSQLFTVIGYLSSGATFCQIFQVDDMTPAPGWPKAAQQAMRDYRDLQVVAVLRGPVSLIGTWENLPTKVPTWTITDLLKEQRFSIFGFNKAKDQEELFALDARSWVHAAHAVMRSQGSVYHFVGAARGIVQVVGKWSLLKASVSIGEATIPPSPGSGLPEETVQ